MQLAESGLAVKDAIMRAFSSVERPTGTDLAPHECPECQEVRERLSPHGFDVVPDETLDWLRDTIPLLGPAGLHYYLPAYLLRVLRDPKWYGLELLMYHLNPSSEDFSKRGEYWAARLGVFSQAQRAAILAFLDWLEDSPVGPDYMADIVGAREVWGQAA